MTRFCSFCISRFFCLVFWFLTFIVLLFYFVSNQYQHINCAVLNYVLVQSMFWTKYDDVIEDKNTRLFWKEIKDFSREIKSKNNINIWTMTELLIIFNNTNSTENWNLYFINLNWRNQHTPNARARFIFILNSFLNLKSTKSFWENIKKIMSKLLQQIRAKKNGMEMPDIIMLQHKTNANWKFMLLSSLL